MDTARWDYDVDTPFQRPIGGSQSAMIYLAIELATRGHAVALATHGTSPGTKRGVVCVGANPGFSAEFLAPFDVVVVLNTARGKAIRALFAGRKSPRLVLWTQHDTDQPMVAALDNQEERDAWDAVALVSEWQADRYRQKFGSSLRSMRVLRNAIAPIFGDIVRPPARDGAAPLLAYTSTPFRGLACLVAAWPQILAQRPDAMLEVYSSMKVYQVGETQDQFHELYRAVAALPQARYCGSQAQPDLAAALTRATLLAFPSIFAETSCISVMEAMAVGLKIVTVDLGALRETTAGHARLVPMANDADTLTNDFARAVTDELTQIADDPIAHAAAMADQMRFARAEYSWRHRVGEWEGWLRELSAS